MRILFISKELIAVGLIPILQREGHDVVLFVQEKALRKCYEGIVKKTDDWELELKWVGKEGLIIFDDVGFGVKQNNLRRRGFKVIGGSKLGDLIETNRKYGQEIFESCGIKILPSFNFETAEEALQFIQKNRKHQWVIKKNGGHKSALNYVGQLRDSQDVEALLSRYKDIGIQSIHLQQKVDGVEIGVGRYFNGNDWVGPIEINFEHKSLMTNGIGPKTPEMGTLMWYESNEENKLFQLTLAKLKNFLRHIDFRGNIEINCIVSGNNVWPLEATARFGVPSTVLQTEIHQSPWGEFLMAVAEGRQYKLRFRKGYGIVVTIAIPPFPYRQVSKEFDSLGVDIFFHTSPRKDDAKHYFFEEVSSRSQEGSTSYYYAGAKGCIGYVAGFGSSVQEARDKAYKRAKNIVIPKMFYREDIGLAYLDRQGQQLKEWGWFD